MDTSSWARSQLSSLLPLDPDSLNQILDYTSTLSTDAVAEHLKALLGDSPKALEFISSYNARREGATASPQGNNVQQQRTGNISAGEAPRTTRKQPKKKAPLHQLPSRKVEGFGEAGSGYKKGDGEDYMASTKAQQARQSNAFTLSETPEARLLPKKTAGKVPPSAAGNLISDLPNVKTKSQTTSRTASPAPKTKISVPGGVAGKGASTTLEDLDSAIRALELQTNPTLNPTSTSSRTCNCNATRHPLLTAAPNCLNCGKIICVKEGLGPCTFCSHPLLDPSEVQAMITSLRQERGLQRQQVGNIAHRKADTTTSSSAFLHNPTKSSMPQSTHLQNALHHRDKLLTYQTQNAQRTTVHDEAADYDASPSGGNAWASPEERARQLRRQQKVLREQEERMRPEWEKRKTVLSIEVGKGGGVVRKMTGKVEAAADEDGGQGVLEEEESSGGGGAPETGGKGAFSRNPLLGGLIRPVWKGKGKDDEGDYDEDKENVKEKRQWRRVQDEYEDNEEVILDGGVYGGRDGAGGGDMRLGEEERAYG